MKKVLILLSVFAIGLTGCGQKTATDSEAQATTESAETATADENVSDATGSEESTAPKKNNGPKLRNAADSVSYALGTDLGRYLARQREVMGDELDQKMVIKGIRNVLAEKEGLTPQETFELMQEYFVVKLPARKLKEGQAYLDEVAKQQGIQKTESGLLYEIITPGSDKKATSLSDTVMVKYRGTLRDGREFDSSYDRPDTISFPLNRVIKGWGEGLQLVGEGGKIKLYIPAELGYGNMPPRGSIIGPNEPLIFEVDLFKVLPTATAETAE